MASAPGSRRKRTRLSRCSWRSTAFAGVVAAAATGLVLSLGEGRPLAPVEPVNPQRTATIASEGSPEPPTARAPTRAAPTPVRLRIPTIGVLTRVTRLGVNPDKTVQVPARAQDAGWYEHGPAPGQLGSSVILGHVDSESGPAVFYRLASLHRGDRISVSLSDGTTARFHVTSINTYPNHAFPARQVYAGDPTTPSLNIVTCGGDYEAAKGGYQANVIVHAEWDTTDYRTT